MKHPTALLPPQAVAAFRIAAKAGFLSKRIWKEHLSHGHHKSWRNRQWKALIDGGYLIPCHEYGFTTDAMILSQKGVAAAIALGHDPVNPPGAKNLWHDDDLISMALTLEKQGLVTQWLTESELKQGKMRDISRFTDALKSKYPDLILQLKHPSDTVLWAIELERTRKEFTRYYDMVQSYGGVSRIDAVLVVAAAPSIEVNIKRAMERLGHPQHRRPILFTTYGEFLKDPAQGEIRMGQSRSSIATAVNRWQAAATTATKETGNLARATSRAAGASVNGHMQKANSNPRN